MSGLPKNNLDTETLFSKLIRLSEVAKFWNSRFKAKGIRNDMTLYQSGKGNVTDHVKKIGKLLQESESS